MQKLRFPFLIVVVVVVQQLLLLLHQVLAVVVRQLRSLRIARYAAKERQRETVSVPIIMLVSVLTVPTLLRLLLLLFGHCARHKETALGHSNWCH